MTTDEQRLRAALAAAAKSDGLHTPAHVERALLAGLRRGRFRRTATRLTVGGAIAAALLLGWLFNRPAAPPAPPVARIEVPAPILAAVPSPPPPPAPAPRRAPRRAVRPPAVPQQSEFIPVGAWQAIEPMERGSIIRVRLPKSSLPGLGIPVSPDRWHESIPADVVLGEDGTMRAVRFVSTRY